MSNQKKQEKEIQAKINKFKDYSICRSSCSVCPYHQGLLKLLDHNVKIVPTLPESDN